MSSLLNALLNVQPNNQFGRTLNQLGSLYDNYVQTLGGVHSWHTDTPQVQTPNWQYADPTYNPNIKAPWLPDMPRPAAVNPYHPIQQAPAWQPNVNPLVKRTYSI